MADFVDITTRNELAEQSRNILGELNGQVQTYCSFVPETMEEKKTFFNATSATGEPLMDHKDTVITMFDCIITPTEMRDERGNPTMVPRCVLMCEEGKVYTASSWGLYRALSRLNGIMGTLHFPDGVSLKVKVVKTNKGKTINLEMV